MEALQTPTQTLPGRTLSLSAALLLVVSRGGSAPPAPIAQDLTFESAEGFVFDARLTVPPADRRTGLGVLLMGGGIGNDLDWTTPGHLEIEGERIQMTVTGVTHADA